MSSDTRRVIINADDFGITTGVNRAIRELAMDGRLSSTSVMTNMPEWQEIADLQQLLGVGIHFNLTVGRPVVAPDLVPSLVDDVGEFVSMPELLGRMRKGRISAAEAERELDAQIARLHQLGIQADHLDTHESLLKYPFFIRILMRLGKRHGIRAVRTYKQRRFDTSRLLNPRRTMISLYLALQKENWKREGFLVADRYDSLLKFGQDLGMAMKQLSEIFEDLPDGILEIGVHPGYLIGDSSYLGDYAKEREVEFCALKSDEAGTLIRCSGADLIRFSAING